MFTTFIGHILQAGQRAGRHEAGRTTANFRVSGLTVVLQHPYWIGPLGRAVGRAYIRETAATGGASRVAAACCACGALAACGASQGTGSELGGFGRRAS
jgi:hypothetical protein